MRERTSARRAVFSSAFTNGALRRIAVSYGCFIGAEWAVWLALLVFAYEHGGTSASALMALVQLVPSALLGPVLGALADHRRPGRVLVLGAAVQAASMAAVATAMALGAPTAVAFALAPATCVGVSMTRPAQAALLPSVVRSANELTASNVLTSWVEQAGKLAVPALTGVLLATSGPALAVAVAAALAAAAGAAVWAVPGVAAEAGPLDLGATARTNLATAWRDPSTRVVLGVDLFYQSFAGMLDLVAVVLGVGVLGLGHGGPGYLTAAVAAGGLASGVLTARMVGRPRLTASLVLGIAGATAALAVLAAVPRTAAAFALMAVVGVGTGVFEVAGRTLLQRAAPADALAGVFALRESLMDVGLGIGIVVVQVAVAVGGYRCALVVPAALAVVLVALAWRPLRLVDGRARVPQ
ncbi:MAG TPA: MFS transporter, partial [Acidimicrobiales bacterium]|nr:MFS transporter [Acidimicrobiales bacterium]